MQKAKRLTIYDRDITYLAEYRGIYWDEFKLITADLAYFTRFLMQIEKNVLIKGGINEDIAELLLFKAISLHNLVIKWNERERNLNDLKSSIDSLKKILCDMVRVNNSKESYIKKQIDPSLVKRVAYIIGGAAIVALNANSTALTAGLNASELAVSAAIGAAFIGDAVEWKKTDVR